MKVSTEPLDWPPHLEPTTPYRRAENGRRAQFRMDTLRAAQHLYAELEKLGARHVRATGALRWRVSDGLPHAEQPRCDPAVAIYCEVEGEPQVYACDRFDTAAANLRAIGLSLEALRSIKRHGALWGQVRNGLRALPPSVAEMSAGEAIRVLGLDRFGYSADKLPEMKVVKAAHRLAVSQVHPDTAGGDATAMARANRARDVLGAQEGDSP